MSGYEIRVVGDKELMRRLEKLSRSLSNKILRPAVAAACRPMRSAARAGAPMVMGNLKASIEQKVKTGKVAVFGVIGPRSDVVGTRVDLFGRTVPEKPSKIAHLVEGGARPHTIRTGRGLKVIWKHPGFAGTHFMERAFDRTSHTTQSIMERKIAEGLEKHA